MLIATVPIYSLVGTTSDMARSQLLLGPYFDGIDPQVRSSLWSGFSRRVLSLISGIGDLETIQSCSVNARGSSAPSVLL